MTTERQYTQPSLYKQSPDAGVNLTYALVVITAK